MKKIKYDGMNEYLYIHTLDNGLDIYMVPNNKIKNFYITYTTKFGSVYTEFKKVGESKYKKIPDGVAHFLEHLTFKMEDMDASDYFSALGSSSNAYTSFDLTCYEVFGNDKFKENLSYLIKYVNTPYYTDENVKNEKGIICEEVKTGFDNPNQQIYFELNRALFNSSKRRNLVAGDVKDVKSTTKNDIMTAYEYFYNPKNMFIVITGSFNPEEAVAIIEEEMLKYNHESFEVEVKKNKENTKVASSFKQIYGNVSCDKVSIGIKIPMSNFKEFNLDEVDLNIYTSIIINSLFGYSSLLKEELISANIINSSVSIDKYITDGFMIITFSVESKYPNRFVSIIKDKLKEVSITKEDFDRKRKVAISNHILEFDNINDVNDTITDYVIERGFIVTDLYTRLNRIDYNTASKIAKKITDKNISVVILSPKKD